ncbi:MAG: hypothetical protein JXA22_04380 [Candidatus Thermoplasmatota archaeon]|nr:hypothetical protein [Candidatus Thermoplasmatota archaeon]
MAEYSDDMNLVPMEIGLQANETILMWALGILFWIGGFFLMLFSVGGNLTPFGIIMYALGGLMLIASQFVTRYNPIKTTRIPITGIIIWVWSLFLAFWILLKGWGVYLGTNPGYFVLFYLVIALMMTGGMLLANFLTTMKILDWMSLDMIAFLYTMGAISLLAGIVHIGFNNPALIELAEISVAQWVMLFLFGMAFIFMLELFNGSHRFNEIIRYAKERSSGEFSLTPVINNYYIMGFILSLIIGFVVLLVLGTTFIQIILQYLLVPQLADSIMANSVYQLFFTMAWIFIPVWIILVLWTEYRSRKEKVEEEELRSKIEKEQKLGVY